MSDLQDFITEQRKDPEFEKAWQAAIADEARRRSELDAMTPALSMLTRVAEPVVNYATRCVLRIPRPKRDA